MNGFTLNREFRPGSVVRMMFKSAPSGPTVGDIVEFARQYPLPVRCRLTNTAGETRYTNAFTIPPGEELVRAVRELLIGDGELTDRIRGAVAETYSPAGEY